MFKEVRAILAIAILSVGAAFAQTGIAPYASPIPIDCKSNYLKAIPFEGGFVCEKTATVLGYARFGALQDLISAESTASSETLINIGVPGEIMANYYGGMGVDSANYHRVALDVIALPAATLSEEGKVIPARVTYGVAGGFPCDANNNVCGLTQDLYQGVLFVNIYGPSAEAVEAVTLSETISETLPTFPRSRRMPRTWAVQPVWNNEVVHSQAAAPPPPPLLTASMKVMLPEAPEGNDVGLMLFVANMDAIAQSVNVDAMDDHGVLIARGFTPALAGANTANPPNVWVGPAAFYAAYLPTFLAPQVTGETTLQFSGPGPFAVFQPVAVVPPGSVVRSPDWRPGGQPGRGR